MKFATFGNWKKNNLYEGLIKTQPVIDIIDNLRRKFVNQIEVDLLNNSFTLKYDFDSNYFIAKKQLNTIYFLINNYGYFFSDMMCKHNIDESEYLKYDENNFKNAIESGFIYITFACEAKYDIEITDIPKYLYHVTPYDTYERKITKIGLVPKSKSLTVSRPDRVYFIINYEDTTQIMNNLYHKNINSTIDNKLKTIYKSWVCLEIDTSTIPKEHNFRLFRDPNYKTIDYIQKGYYTLNNIPPYSIKLIEKRIY